MPESYDPHELLGLTPAAGEDEIRRAFRRKAKSVHPDVSDAPDAAEEFKRLKDAHDLLIERQHHPLAAPPEAGEDLYRPAREVTEEDRESIINAFRRRRESEERRKSRRRSAVKGQARRAERQNDAFQEEMARRRAAFESRQREESQREQEERLRAEREQQRAADETERRRVEELRRQEQEALARVKRERETRERAKRSRPIDDSPLECAWKGCRVSDDLAVAVDTALGPRRFCRAHYDEYLEFRRSKQRQASAR
ncbi:MAG: J domain-containing protein [Chloroflexi bacterium]|nr:J domain-containing protein [Chloroflexota bacterium]MYF80527.1 J domain-containing protein [Chloroflexota bacterium]MYI03801.1 J domain-containing protein [Chloroflexota bacterium]